MEQYIPKSALVAEIEKRKRTWQHQDQQYVNGGKDVCDYLLGFLDALEVKEVDLEVELANYNREYVDENGFFNTEHLAKHFFELGLKVRQ